MTTIYYESDADLGVLDGQRIAVVGYGNQGRSWALNLRDSGCAPIVCVRRDDTREQAEADGFEAHDVEAANDADIICILVPDDVIALLPLAPTRRLVRDRREWVHARLRSPRPARATAGWSRRGCSVPRCAAATRKASASSPRSACTTTRPGDALARVLAIAKAIGGLRQGGLALTPMQEAVLDLGVEQVLSPALAAVNNAFVQTMMEHDIPIEAIVVELVLSGEVERTYRLLREVGYAVQSEFHSPTSQYGQLTRRGRYDHLDFVATMRGLADDIESGRFADEWDAERDAGYPTLTRLKEQHAGPAVREYEAELRRRLGPQRSHQTAS